MVDRLKKRKCEIGSKLQYKDDDTFWIVKSIGMDSVVLEAEGNAKKAKAATSVTVDVASVLDKYNPTTEVWAPCP